jgi:hypothetical protein
VLRRESEIKAMEQSPNRPSSDGANRLVSTSLHTRVYAVLIGLVVWMVLWVWSFIGGGETDYLLFIVSGFLCVVAALQLILMRLRRAEKLTNSETVAHHPGADGTTGYGEISLRNWVRGEFQTEEAAYPPPGRRY